jgi:hypothetical protein
MKINNTENVLRQSLADLRLARKHLDYSYGQVATLPQEIADFSPDQLESVEAFTSRFARVVYLLVNKVLLALDRHELLPQGSLLYVINRAEKRLLVESSIVLREMKEVRNIIAHDYTGAKMSELLLFCSQQKLSLDKICDRTEVYANQLIDNMPSSG